MPDLRVCAMKNSKSWPFLGKSGMRSNLALKILRNTLK